jgi:broad specificity phosphatase PhoE
MAGFPSRLWLVRHAESDGNVANAEALASGRHELDLAIRDMDVPLSARGEAQARALGTGWLASLDEPPAVVWCSPYHRALETANLAMAAAGVQLPVVCDERLREREFGILDRLTKAGIEARFPEQAAARAFLGKFFHRPPGGESWADVAFRARSVFHDIRLDHAGEGVVVVAHQAVVMVWRYVLEQLTEQEVLGMDKQTEVENTAVTTYEGDGVARPALVAFNDVSHLPDDLRTAAPDVPVAPRG